MKNVYTLLDEINFEERVKKEIDLIKSVKNTDNFDNVVSYLVFTNFVFSFIQEIYEKIYDENEVLQKKLDIAVGVLERYADESSWNDCEIDTVEENNVKDYDSHYGTNGFVEAQKALEKIKEIK